MFYLPTPSRKTSNLYFCVSFFPPFGTISYLEINCHNKFQTNLLWDQSLFPSHPPDIYSLTPWSCTYVEFHLFHLVCLLFHHQTTLSCFLNLIHSRGSSRNHVFQFIRFPVHHSYRSFHYFHIYLGNSLFWEHQRISRRHRSDYGVLYYYGTNLNWTLGKKETTLFCGITVIFFPISFRIFILQILYDLSTRKQRKKTHPSVFCAPNHNTNIFLTCLLATMCQLRRLCDFSFFSFEVYETCCWLSRFRSSVCSIELKNDSYWSSAHPYCTFSSLRNKISVKSVAYGRQQEINADEWIIFSTSFSSSDSANLLLFSVTFSNFVDSKL